MRTPARRRVVVFFAIVFVAAGGLVAVAASASQPPALATLEGRLVMAHGDNFHGRMTNMAAAVVTSHGRVPIEIPAGKHAQFMARAGQRVRVRGQRDASTFNATNVSTLEASPSI